MSYVFRFLLVWGIATSVFEGAEAQAQSQNCRWIGSIWNCVSTPAPQSQPAQPIQAPNGGTMLDSYRSGKEDRRDKATPNPPSKPVATTFDMTTGNGYMAACNSEDLDVKLDCMNFTVGMFEGIPAGITLAKGERVYCLPNGVTIGQLQDVLLKYLSDHPDIRHLPTSVIAAFSLKLAFPCAPR